MIAAHVFAYQLAHGLCAARLLAPDVVIRHRCDEACCQNPAHLALGTATMNIAEYRTRRHRVGGPLGDTRGAAGRARAIRAAVLGARAEGPDAVEAALAAALTAGRPLRPPAPAVRAAQPRDGEHLGCGGGVRRGRRSAAVGVRSRETPAARGPARTVSPSLLSGRAAAWLARFGRCGLTDCRA